ncbi:MAG: 30S ribosomal protein S4 [Deltaproteobacteria bacterium]|nr:30S ribosomal protein S4 [Deltaproteobacteria bacterium]MBW1872557.1 30S ribosomal protein S4 [Deltaproteobacteria bacterium]
MARYTGSVCKFCRREKLKLFLKGDRCFSEKCSVDRRPYPPGEHGQRRTKFSPYGVQLREKQKVKRIYGFLEKQFRITFDRAQRMRGITGENLLLLLERRIDNMVYRMGLARTRREARQLVRHGHFRVNNKKVTIPSFLLKVGDEVQIREKSRKIELFNDALEAVERRGVPPWIELDRKEMKATVSAFPVREDITMPIQEQMIVELYSK